MEKKDLVSVAITFIVGLVAGAYLYLTEIAPLEKGSNVPNQSEALGFSIVSDVYGGCQDTCSSFQVTSDGSYRYLYTPEGTSEQVIRQGNLPYRLRNEIKDMVVEDDLKRQARETEPRNCNSYTDGNDVLYEVTINGQEFILDSCGTAVEGNSELWLALHSIWQYLENSGNNN